MRIEDFTLRITPKREINSVTLNVKVLAHGKVFGDSKEFGREFLEQLPDDDFKSLFSRMFKVVESEFVKATDHFIAEEEKTPPLIKLAKRMTP